MYKIVSDERKPFMAEYLRPLTDAQPAEYPFSLPLRQKHYLFEFQRVRFSVDPLDCPLFLGTDKNEEMYIETIYFSNKSEYEIDFLNDKIEIQPCGKDPLYYPLCAGLIGFGSNFVRLSVPIYIPATVQFEIKTPVPISVMAVRFSYRENPWI